MGVGFQNPDFHSMTEPEALTEAHKSNNATTTGTSPQSTCFARLEDSTRCLDGPRVVLDLSSLRKGTPGYQSNRPGNFQPLYNSLTRMEKRTIKVREMLNIFQMNEPFCVDS